MDVKSYEFQYKSKSQHRFCFRCDNKIESFYLNICVSKNYLISMLYSESKNSISKLHASTGSIELFKTLSHH
jgi:hypothetical protein